MFAEFQPAIAAASAMGNAGLAPSEEDTLTAPGSSVRSFSNPKGAPSLSGVLRGGEHVEIQPDFVAGSLNAAAGLEVRRVAVRTRRLLTTSWLSLAVRMVACSTGDPHLDGPAPLLVKEDVEAMQQEAQQRRHSSSKAAHYRCLLWHFVRHVFCLRDGVR